MQLSISPDLAVKISTARGVLKALEREASDAILSQLGFVEGDRVEDKNTGLHYIVASAHGFWTGQYGASATVSAHRIYKSGRREGRRARSSTHLSAHQLEKVGPVE